MRRPCSTLDFACLSRYIKQVARLPSGRVGHNEVHPLRCSTGIPTHQPPPRCVGFLFKPRVFPVVGRFEFFLLLFLPKTPFPASTKSTSKPNDRITVPVGTLITERPPDGSVRARLRIRLLRRMSGVEACVGIRMQDARLWNPSVQQWGKLLPPHLCSLTSPDENTPPQPVNTSLKYAQLSRVSGHSMVLVITQHNSPKPCTDRGRTIMLPALKLSLDGFQLRDHPLLRRDPPDDECSITDALPTEVSKPRK